MQGTPSQVKGRGRYRASNFWSPLQGGLKYPSHAAGSGKPRGGRRVAGRATNCAGFATDSDARPIPSGAGRRAGRSGGGSEWVSAQGALRPGSPGTNLSTGCSEFRPQPAATGGPIPGSSQLRAGTHRSARTGEEARHPLLMEWAGAESHLVCTPLLSAPGGEGVEGRTPNHCVPRGPQASRRSESGGVRAAWPGPGDALEHG